MRWIVLSASLCSAMFVAEVSYAQSGYQTINGTRVFTQVDQARGVATFSNDCGSQTLTQGQLQAGAIPDQIIPCPRPQSSSRPSRSNAFDDLCQFYANLMRDNCQPTDDGVGSPTCDMDPIIDACGKAGRSDVISWARQLMARVERTRQAAADRERKAEATAAAAKAMADGDQQRHVYDYFEAEKSYLAAAQAYQSIKDVAAAQQAKRDASGAVCNGYFLKFHDDFVAAGKLKTLKSMRDVDPNFEKACAEAGLANVVTSFVKQTIAKGYDIRYPPEQQQSCGVLVGEPVHTQCVDETSDTNCSCLTLSNTCSFDITVTFMVIGGSGNGSAPLGPGQATRNFEACSTRRDQTVHYLGWRKR